MLDAVAAAPDASTAVIFAVVVVADVVYVAGDVVAANAVASAIASPTLLDDEVLASGMLGVGLPPPPRITHGSSLAKLELRVET